jgi:UDP-N-acetylglucosamine 2-epimerase (non-hydrolysing)
MKSLKITHVVGARPNFMKASPVMRALDSLPGVSQRLVHTGQHYDKNMSDVFFRDLELDPPDVNLEVGSGSHAQQTANVMLRMDDILGQARPDLVLVYGDVNSTLAATIVCVKLKIPVGHVEAGLRSFDRDMPEEINRILTDRIADHLYTPSKDGDENLATEGVDPARIHLVGNVMIDTLTRLLPKALTLWPRQASTFGLKEKSFGLVTLHRPSNVDEEEKLSQIMRVLERVSRRIPLVFPLHPRTRERLRAINLDQRNLTLCEPLGYLEFLSLQARARLIITDSGGIQEETTYLQVPCLTVRKNTERPVTTTIGTNRLVGEDMDALYSAVETVLENGCRQGEIPPFWDGKAGLRIAEHIGKEYAGLNASLL